MINPSDQCIEKIVELIEAENLFSAEELSLMEDYFNGDAGEEILEKFAWRDLSGMSRHTEIYYQCRTLAERGRTEEAGRIGRFFYAVGEVSGYRVFPAVVFQKEWAKTFRLESAQKAALYAANMGEMMSCFKKQNFEELLELAEHKPEIVKKAIECRTGKAVSGILILLMAYFFLKYPNTEPQEEKEGKKGGLSAIGGLFDASKPQVQVEEEDIPLLKQYENIVISRIPQIYDARRFPQQDADEIMEAAANDRVDGRILNLAAAGYLKQDAFAMRVVSTAAFMNFALSRKLANTACVCFATDVETALNFLQGMDMRGDMDKLGRCLDVMFRIDSAKFIQWAAKNHKLAILKEQFGRNREAYMDYMDSADYDIYNTMAPIVKQMDPELFNKRVSGEVYRQQAKVIDAFVKSTNNRVPSILEDMKKYLRGEGGMEQVEACGKPLRECYYWGSSAHTVLKSYQAVYGYDAFSNRCETLLLAGNGSSFYQFFVKDGEVDGPEVKRLFAAVDSEGLDLVSQLNGYAGLVDGGYNEKWTNALEKEAKEIFKDYLANRREETLAAFSKAGSVGRRFGLQVMGEDAQTNKETILGFAQDTAKSVKEALLDILYGQKGWETEVVSLLSSKKAADRETAVNVLAKWKAEAEQANAKGASAGEGTADAGSASVGKESSAGEGGQSGKGQSAEHYAQILMQALEAEKNAKVRALLENLLHKSMESSDGRTVSEADLVKDIHKGNKKRSLAWAYETPFSKVHKKDGTEADEEYLQAIFLCYSSMSPCGVNQSAKALAEALDEREFAVYVNELFDKWMEAGAESKKRWVLYAAAIHGGDDIVKKLHHQIQEWPQAARGAIAGEAVQALALSPKPQGLLIVDGISRKFKFKQVKAAAVKALEFAASQLGITTEELADRIVPNLGFDENMQRVFDYGERKFTVTITPALEIEVFDESGRKLKNLPAPGKKDDEAKAAAAYDEFKQMKKQMKTTVTSQKMRLEMALSTERRWSAKAWKDLFVKNPIMHQFAIGLIWGVYEDRKLVTSFRYMEDGSFNTEDEEEFTLPEETADASAGAESGGQGRFIGLVHPIELSEESLNTWKEQLEDYEITQPIDQLSRPVYYRTEEEGTQKALERFGGLIVNDLSLGGKLTAQGWYRGSVEDAGGFFTYYREDKELNLGAVLSFSGTYVGGLNEDVTIFEIRFFKAGELVTWYYGKEEEEKACPLSEVPERYFSEIVLQITKATASSSGRNEDWKKKR